MDFIDAVQVLRRRWWIFAIGLVLVFGGVVWVRSFVPVQNQASGLMLFLLPSDAPEGTGKVNPYLNLPSGLTTTASLIASEAVSDDVAEEIASTGDDALYSVALVPDTGPLLTITAKDPDPEVAVATRDRVMDWVEQRLIGMQDNVEAPDSQFMFTTRTSVTTSAEILPGSRLRAMAGAGAAGMVVLLIAVFGLDRLIMRRRRTHESKDAVASDDPDEPEELAESKADEDPDEEPDEPDGPGQPEKPKGQQQPQPSTGRGDPRDDGTLASTSTGRGTSRDPG